MELFVFWVVVVDVVTDDRLQGVKTLGGIIRLVMTSSLLTSDSSEAAAALSFFSRNSLRFFST